MSGPRRPYQLHCPILKRHGNDLARYCFDRSYETWPELDERYGERGRHHTAEDNYWHLDYLDTAAHAQCPEIFSDYTDWLVGLLTFRGLDRCHVAGVYGFLSEALDRVECPPQYEDQRRFLLAILRENRERLLVGCPEVCQGKWPGPPHDL
jgi:hypothetical protein